MKELAQKTINHSQLIESAPKLFNYSQLDEKVADSLRAKENAIRTTIGNSCTIIGQYLKEAQDELALKGLAQKTRSYTTPYREHIPKYAMVQARENYSSFVWNYIACTEYIDKWLKENNLYETFYAMETTHKLEQFIDSLYSEYA